MMEKLHDHPGIWMIEHQRMMEEARRRATLKSALLEASAVVVSAYLVARGYLPDPGSIKEY